MAPLTTKDLSPEVAKNYTDYTNKSTGSTALLTPEIINSNLGSALGRAGWAPGAPNVNDPAQAPQYGYVGGNKYQLDASGKPMGFEAPTSPNTLSSNLAVEDKNAVSSDLDRRRQVLNAQQQSDLQMQLANETNSINQTYDTRQRQLGQTQTEENATNQATQFRLGREATPYAQSATEKLNQLHTDQLSELAGQRQSLISKASQAFQAGKIALAKEMLAHDEKLYTDQENIKQQQRENTSRDLADKINLAQEDRAQADFEFKKLEQIAKTGGTLDATTMAGFDKAIGTPGFTQQYLDAAKAAKTLENTNDLNDFKLKLDIFAKGLPKGESVSFTLPDGSVYAVKGQKEGPTTADITEYEYAKGQGFKGTLQDWTKKKPTSNNNKNNDSPAPAGQSFDQWLQEKEKKESEARQQSFAYNTNNPKILEDLKTQFQLSQLGEKKASALVVQNINRIVDNDGFISPEEYLNDKKLWMDAGYNAKKFDTLVSEYKDPNQKYVDTKEPKPKASSSNSKNTAREYD